MTDPAIELADKSTVDYKETNMVDTVGHLEKRITTASNYAPAKSFVQELKPWSGSVRSPELYTKRLIVSLVALSIERASQTLHGVSCTSKIVRLSSEKH